MTEQQWAVVDEVAGSFQADVIEGLLKAQEIPVLVSKPGAGVALGVTLGSLGRVQILVPDSDLARAKQVVEDYYSGAYGELDLADFDEEIDQADETSGE